MATNFPTNLDTWPALVDNQTRIDAVHINDIQDAVVALETKIGITNDPDTSTLDYKIRNFWNSTAPRKIWLYNNTAPTYWSTVAGVGDRVLGCKGGGEFTTGGDVAGDGWVITGFDNDTHNHKWYYQSGGYGYTYNSAGAAFAMTTLGAAGEGITGVVVELYSKACGGTWEGVVVDSADNIAYTYNDTHTHTHPGTWRPVGALGILVKFDG